MEAFKLEINVDDNRKVVVDLPHTIPLGQAEMMVIIQPLKQKKVGQGENDHTAREITLEQTAEMRNCVLTFEQDWNAPAMDIYDDF